MISDEINYDLINHFKTFNDPTKLPGFIEAYIKNNLNIPLKKIDK